MVVTRRKRDGNSKDDLHSGNGAPSTPRRKSLIGRSPSTSSTETAVHTTKPKRRRRLRGGEASLDDLARAIVRGRRVLFITGAGLSVASGIRPFRTGRPEDGSWKQKKPSQKSSSGGFTAASQTGLQAGLWDQVLWTTATRESFRQDPLKWYNEFWLPHLGTSHLGAKPNAGHGALQKILQMFPDNCTQITQNIDGLQSDSTPKGRTSRLVEIHGRVGLYKCLPESDSDTDSDSDDDEERPVHLGHRRKARYEKFLLEDPTRCPYQWLDSLPSREVMLPDKDYDQLMDMEEGKAPSEPKLLSEPPRCPVCNNIVMPQALLFDEGYHSHSFYQFELAEDWIRDCHVIVFCGTSFAVNLTTVALDHARDMDVPVFNFNLHDPLTATARLNVSNIMGKADETFPKLVEAIERVQSEESDSQCSKSD